MANIKDVAAYANLSVATVSRYLNKNGYISEASKKKIENAISALNYKPNHIARSLSKKQSQLIGIIVPDIQNPFFPQLARAIEDTANQYNYTVVLCNTDGDINKEKLYIERLSQNYVAGMLVATSIHDPDYYETINTPIVALDRSLGETIPVVITDNFNGAKTATEHLIQCGAKHIVHLRGPVGLKSADERMSGFSEVIQHHDIQSQIIETGFNFKDALITIENLLKADDTIDGIFASNDEVAIAAVKVIQSFGKKIPEDIQIVGFDGIELGTMISPELTTICQDIYKIGQHATEMLIHQIEGTEYINKEIKVETTLKIRGTTRKEATL